MGFAVILFSDLETFSTTDIRCGTHKYAEAAEIMVWAYALDDGPVNVWDLTSGAPMPADLHQAYNDPAVMQVWQNGAGFDRVVLQHCGYPMPIERMFDTMVCALAHSLPGSLEQLGEVLGLADDMQKLKAGKGLIRLFCMPRPKNMKLRRATSETHPAEWAEFLRYAEMDIVAMREIYNRLPKWNYAGQERELWHLDCHINNRGICVDLDLASAAIEATNRAQTGLAEDTLRLTDGEVGAATQRDAMLLHILEAYGIALPDLRASTVAELLESGGRGRADDLPQPVRDLLTVRLQASMTSAAKYKRVIEATSSDGRLRGLLQFCGASRTGRWAGRTFQPQNLPRPSLEQDEIDIGIEALKNGSADLVFDNVMALASSALRGVIVAPTGKKLVIADLSNIEGRVLAWLAGETWKLDAFADYDAGNGPDLYKMAYAKSFGITPDAVTKPQRQVGKVQELALGYEGGVGAFLTFAAAYAIDLEQMGRDAIGSIPADILKEARGSLEWSKRMKRDTFGLSDDAWIVCESFKRAWRYGHPNIAAWWKEIDAAARSAIANKGVEFAARKVSFRRNGSWLLCTLPSGRKLSYPGIAIDEDQITYMGVNQYSRQWSRLKTYSGKLAENITQAVARDVLASTMPAIEAAGYPIVLSVHDELLCEADDTKFYSHEKLAALMSAPPAWAKDLPLAAAGFETYRYKKD
jgi:DNA polymerase